MTSSVVICTYNGEKYIKKQIESIINQSILPDEIIICDDNSRDNTVKIIESELERYTGKYVIFKNEKNLGVTKNFEKGIKSASGEIVFLSDQDDVWHYNKIEKMKQVFQKNEKCVLAFSNANLLLKEKSKMTLWDSLGFNPDKVNSYQLSLLKQSLITGATMVVRKDYCNKIMPFPIEWIHDGWIAINAECYGDVCSVSKVLMDYRIHGSNVIGINYNYYRKIKAYLSSIKELKLVREERYRRYSIFYLKNKDKLTIELNKEVKSCILFWKSMRQLDKRKKISSIKCIFSHLKRGDYKRYYTGLRGAVRDFISII